MSKDRHTKQNTLFRQPRKSGNLKIRTSQYITDYDYQPLDLDDITNIKCTECSSIFSKIKYSRCPICHDLDNYLSEYQCDLSKDPFDYMSYGEWMTSYNILTLTNVVNGIWWTPTKLEVKPQDYYLKENKAIMTEHNNSRIFISGKMVYYGELFNWYNEQLIYHDDVFEELADNPLIIKKAAEYREKMKDDEYYHCLTDTSYITNYLFKHHKSQFMVKENIPFRKVFCVNYNCDICQTESTCQKDDIMYFRCFLTSRNPESILECQDYCDCSATRVRNYDYCQECFFNLPLQKAEQYLLLTRLFYRYDACIDDILYHCSNIVSEYNYKH